MVLRNHQRLESQRPLKLAPGIRLCGGGSSPPALEFSTQGKVTLNQHAVAILELCDGSRNRERVIVDAIQRASGGMRGADVGEFLDAALSRAWIIEDP